MKAKELENKKILVLGLGREGESSFRFLRRNFPQKIIALADVLELKKLPSKTKSLIKKDKKTELHFGKNYLKSLKNYDVIIRTPGISKKTIAPYVSKKQIITSQTEIFLEKYAPKTIGITGTKGKGTTAGLVYKILKEAGLKVMLIGNIGKPVLDYFDDPASQVKWFVAEISSHQLEGLKVSPHVAVFLNIYKDHLDYFKNFKNYFEAKTNITRWQNKNDYFVFGNDFSQLKDLAKKTKAKKIAFGKNAKNGCYLLENTVCYRGKPVINQNKLPLAGEHFLYDAMAAIAITSIFKIPLPKIKKSIINFKTAAHRLERIGKFKGIKFINDSAATTPESTIAVLNSLKEIETLILGGSEKGTDFGSLAEAVIKNGPKTLILFPTTGQKIWQEISKKSKNYQPKHFFVNNMKEAVNLCFKHTSKGKICLLSPACASFTTFKDYQDRGNRFKKYIKESVKNDKNQKQT